MLENIEMLNKFILFVYVSSFIQIIFSANLSYLSFICRKDSASSKYSDHSSSSGYKTQRQDTSSTNMSNNLSPSPSPTTSQYQQYQAPYGQVRIIGKVLY